MSNIPFVPGRPNTIALLSVFVPNESPCKASVSQLYAFFYVPNPPFADSNGWSIYSPREEFGRMGVGTRSKAWRFTDINKDYSVRHIYCDFLSLRHLNGGPTGAVLPNVSCAISRPNAHQRYHPPIRG